MLKQTGIHETRSVYLRDDEGQPEHYEFAEPGRNPYPVAVEAIEIALARTGNDVLGPWQVTEVDVVGHHVFDDEVSGLHFHREFHAPDVRGRRWHLTDLPAPIAALVDEIRINAEES